MPIGVALHLMFPVIPQLIQIKLGGEHVLGAVGPQ